MNIAADGTRVSAARAFRHPALSRPNLTLLLNTAVVKLNFKGTRCVGVKIMTGGAATDIAADKEVTLAAGSINSPKLLMLSGVGEATVLRRLGIDVVEKLARIYRTMCSCPACCLSTKARCRIGRPTAMPSRQRLTYRVVPRARRTLTSSSNNCRLLHPKWPRGLVPLPQYAFTIAPALVQPTSRGSVRLASNDFQDAAMIDGNYLGTEQDFAAIVRAIETVREIGNQRAFNSVREVEIMPGSKATANEIRELARLGPRRKLAASNSRTPIVPSVGWAADDGGAGRSST